MYRGESVKLPMSRKSRIFDSFNASTSMCETGIINLPLGKNMLAALGLLSVFSAQLLLNDAPIAPNVNAVAFQSAADRGT